jgi:hypothetical protein
MVAKLSLAGKGVPKLSLGTRKVSLDFTSPFLVKLIIIRTAEKTESIS